MEFALLAILVPFTFLAFAGTALLIWGWRGRRTDDHPICRRCHFDLFGKPPDSPRCPECGTDVTRPRAVRTGARVKRRSAIATGLVLLLVGLAPLAGLAIGTARGVSWNHYKPVWWLLLESDRPALSELRTRQARHALTDADSRRLVARALEVQADHTRTWDWIWGDIVRDARNAGRVTDDQWKQYAAHSLELKLETRPRVARGNTLPARTWVTGRTGQIDLLYVGLRRLSLTLDGVKLDEWEDTDTGSCSILNYLPNVRHEDYVKLDQRIARLPDGPHRIRLTVEWRVIDGTDQHLIGKPPLVTGQTTLESDVQLLPQHQDTIEQVTDDSLRPAIEHSLKLGPESPNRNFPAAIHIKNEEYGGVQFYLTTNNPPLGLAFTATLRDPAGREFPLRERWIWGTGTAFSPGQSATNLLSGELDGFDADRADIILRPSTDRALKTPDLTRIWGRDVILKNVPVQWDPGAARPTKLPH